MKSFLVKLLYFLIPVLIFLVGYEMILRSSNLPNIYSYKNKLLDEQYDGIVLGNSHALRGIIVENLSSEVINLANVSQSINIDLLWLKDAIKTKKLKFVILNFSVPTLTVDIKKSTEDWRLKNYNLYTRLKLNYSPKYNFEFLNGLQIKNFKKVGNKLLGKSLPKDNYLIKGSFPLDAYSDNLQKHAIKASKRHKPKVGNVESNEFILRKIIALSKINNFDLVIVTPPAYETYRSLIPENIKTKLFSLLTDVEAQNKNVYWLNNFDNDSFDSKCFKDSDHLNLNGAIIFTNQINDFLKTLVD